ncbi:hypothetical protein D3C84_999440 [compost metagenome]
MQEGQAPPRQAQRAASDLDQQIVRQRLFRKATAVDPDRQDGEQQQNGHRNGTQQGLGESQGGRSRRQVAQGCQRSQWGQGATQREAGKQCHAGDFGRSHTIAGI